MFWLVNIGKLVSVELQHLLGDVKYENLTCGRDKEKSVDLCWPMDPCQLCLVCSVVKSTQQHAFGSLVQECLDSKNAHYGKMSDYVWAVVITIPLHVYLRTRSFPHFVTLRESYGSV